MNFRTLERLNCIATKRGEAVLATWLDTGAQVLVADFDSLDCAKEDQPVGFRNHVLDTRAKKTSSVQVIDEREIFLDYYGPTVRLIIVGAVHISQILAPMARLAGLEVVIIDPRAGYTTSTRFPDTTLINAWPDAAFAELKIDTSTAIVALSHDPKIDEPALVHALGSEAFYIGALGSRATHRKRCDRLFKRGCTGSDIERIHAPIGLHIGGRSAETIAVSVLAEIFSVRHEVMPEHFKA